jgi:A/G-specific adenine glycosylase
VDNQNVIPEILGSHGHTLNLKLLHEKLCTWDARQRRIFPWRLTDNPFHIMMAELMLRRTQAKQVVGIYNAFVEKYPDPAHLASAPAEEVTQLLFSLGLAWRVPAFQQIAQQLVEKYNGQVPSNYDALITLPGVGDYVASAVCCFAFGQAISIVDTNTVRIAGRLFSVPTHAESRRRKPIRMLLERLLDRKNPRAYNYAMLDLAALICTPFNPQCARCPLVCCCMTGQERVTCQNG